MPDALSLSRTELPEEIATAIEALAFASYSHGLGVGDGSLSQMEPRRSAEARSALAAAILSRLGEAEARREEWEQAAKVEASQRRHALARVERLEKALEPFAGAARKFACAIGPDGIDDGLSVTCAIDCRDDQEATLSTRNFSQAAAILSVAHASGSE